MQVLIATPTPAPIPAVVFRQKNSHYLIEDPQTKLCIRLHCEPTPAGDALRIVPRLSERAHASPFPSHEAAAVAFAHYLGGCAMDIVRVDA